MKILQIMAGAQHGGAETAYVDMCIAMHEAGEHIEAVTRANDVRVPRLEEAGIKVHTLPFSGKIDVYTPLRLRKIIKVFQPDIVQTWMSRAPSMTPKWSAKMGIPRYFNFARMGTPYKLKYFKNMDYFVSLTPDIAEHMEHNGVEPRCIRQIPNFAEVEPIDTPINRADYGTPDDAPLILGIGRLHPDKAFDTLIRVAHAMPQVHVWIAGEGVLRGELEALIEELGVADRVKLLGWRTDRAALYEASDVCAFISRDEGFGTVFLQSWAQKTPLVVSDCDGPRQFCHHEQDCLMAKMDDIEGTKMQIQRLIDEPQLADKIIKNGFERYDNEFTKEICLQRYLEFYHDIRSQNGS